MGRTEWRNNQSMFSSVTSVNLEFMNSKVDLKTEHQLDHYSKIEKVKDGAYLLYIRSVHLKILRFPMGGAHPTNTGIFLRGLLNYSEKAELSKCFRYPNRKLGVTMHFSEIIKLQY